MSDATLERQFVQRMQELLVSLPYDLKVLFEVMTDEDIQNDARTLAAGAVIYCLSASDPIPDTMGLVGFVDDVIVVRVALEKAKALAGEDMDDYPERFSEQFATLENDIKLFRDFLGDNILWIDWRMEKLLKTKYKGKLVSAYVEDEELSQRLYEEGLEFTTEYEIDDDQAAKLTSGKPVIDAFAKVYQVEKSRQ